MGENWGGAPLADEASPAMSTVGKRICTAILLIVLSLCSLSPGAEPKPRAWAIEPSFALHKDRILAVAFTKDGKLMATAGADDAGEMALWDVKGAKKKFDLHGHKESVWSVAFTPDGKTLISSCSADKSLRFWNVETGKQIAKVDDPPQPFWRLAVSPDGEKLAVALWNESPEETGTVLLYDMALPPKLRSKLEGHAGSVRSLAFSPDGSTLAAASGKAADSSGVVWLSGEVRLWDPTTGKLTRTLKGHDGEIKAVAFSPDGATLATAARLWGDPASGVPDSGEVKVWDLPTGKVRASAKYDPNGLWSATFSPDGRLLALGGMYDAREKDGVSQVVNGRIYVVDPETLRLITELHGEYGLVNALTFIPGTRTLASCEMKQVKMWDLSDFGSN